MKILGDFTTSVRKALEEIDPLYDQLPGLVVCGTHAPTIEEMNKQILEISLARDLNVPVLGICWGMQVMAIEYARNTLNIKTATTEELEPESEHCMVLKMAGLVVGMKKVEGKEESHWHNYKVADLSVLKDYWDIVREGDVIERMRLKGHKFHVGIQYHAEYQSSHFAPHPILVEFIKSCK